MRLIMKSYDLLYRGRYRILYTLGLVLLYEAFVARVEDGSAGWLTIPATVVILLFMLDINRAIYNIGSKK